MKTLSGSNSTYSYDAKNRLIQDDTTGTNAHDYTFTFDPVDNRLSATDSGSYVEYAYDGASRLTTSVNSSGTTTFGYSLEGTQTSVQEPPGGNLYTFTQDVEYRLASSTGPSGTRDWYYDANGKMQYLSRPGSQGTVSMVWDRDDYLQIRNASTITNYSTAYGQLLAEKDGSNVQIDYIPDALGSIVECIDANQNITYTAAYKPWGGILAATGTQPYFTWVGNLGYNSFVGITYAEYSVRARLYSSKTDRWTSVDQLWPRQVAYVYVRATLVAGRDRSGLHALPTDCCCDQYLVKVDVQKHAPPMGSNAPPKNWVGPWPPGSLPDCQQSFGGWLITYELQVHWHGTQKTLSPGGCTLAGNETRTGTDTFADENVPWQPSAQYTQWSDCYLKTIPDQSCDENCNPVCSSSCKIVDWPGMWPCAGSLDAFMPFTYHILGDVYFGGACGSCVHVHYDLTETWNSLPSKPAQTESIKWDYNC